MPPKLTHFFAVLLTLTGFTFGADTPLPRPNRVVLFDFESGIGAWVGNPWGGGKCGARGSSRTAFGKGALEAWYEAPVPQGRSKGMNVIAPYLPADAAWRKYEWRFISFYVLPLETTKQPSFNIILEASEKEHPTYSKTVYLDQTRWTRVSLDTHTFWNRGRKRIDLRKLKRFYLNRNASGRFLIDRVCLEAGFTRPLLQHKFLANTPSIQVHDLELKAYGPNSFKVQARVVSQQALPVKLVAKFKGPRFKRFSEKMDTELSPEPEDDVNLPIQTHFTREGLSKFDFEILDRRNQPLYRCTGRLRILLPKALSSRPEMILTPQPRKMKTGKGFFTLPETARAALLEQGQAMADRPLEFLGQELKRWYGVAVQPTNVREARLLLAVAGDGADLASLKLRRSTRKRLMKLDAQGYIVQITPRRTILAGRSPAGLFYAVQTFLQVIRRSTEPGHVPRARALTITDWPSLPIRAVSMPIPSTRWGHPKDPPVQPDQLMDFMRRTMIPYKMNFMVLIVRQGLKYQQHPKIAGPAAWTPEQVRKVCDFAKDNFIEIAPSINSLGHANWMTLSNRSLSYREDYHTLDTENPDVWKTLTDCYDEVIDIYRPKYFHIGFDEVRWKDHLSEKSPEALERLAEKKQEVFVNWLKRIHTYLTGKGLKVMMWGDMVLRDHNGGPPYQLSRVRKELPRDLTVCNWSAGVAPLANRIFSQEHFAAVIQSNSSGVARPQSLWLKGNMVGIWGKVPWLTEGATGKERHNSYLSILHGAEYSWNLLEDFDHARPSISASYFKQREDTLLADVARQPENVTYQYRQSRDKGFKLFYLDTVANTAAIDPEAGDGQGWMDLGPQFDLRHMDGCARNLSGVMVCTGTTPKDKPTLVMTRAGMKPVKLPISGKFASLYFFQTAVVPPGEERAVRDRFKKKENYLGIPIAEYRVKYADGTQEAFPVRYGYHVRNWLQGDWPYAFGALAYLRFDTEKSLELPGSANQGFLYLMQWINPQPVTKIDSVELAPLDTEIRLALISVTGKP